MIEDSLSKYFDEGQGRNHSVVFHHTTPYEALKAMVKAEELVVCNTSLAYTAALITKGSVYGLESFPFDPMPHWITVYKFTKSLKIVRPETQVAFVLPNQQEMEMKEMERKEIIIYFNQSVIISQASGILYKATEELSKCEEFDDLNFIYKMDKGTRRAFTDYDAFIKEGYSDNDFELVLNVPCAALAIIPEGQPYK